jgi:hypothetical protein
MLTQLSTDCELVVDNELNKTSNSVNGIPKNSKVVTPST